MIVSPEDSKRRLVIFSSGLNSKPKRDSKVCRSTEGKKSELEKAKLIVC